MNALVLRIGSALILAAVTAASALSSAAADWLWARQIGTETGDLAKAIAATADGTIAVCAMEMPLSLSTVPPACSCGGVNSGAPARTASMVWQPTAAGG